MSTTKIIATVKPGSKTDMVQKVGDEFVVRTKARAVDGKANEAVIALIADYFDVPKTRVQLVRGATSKHKVLVIAM